MEIMFKGGARVLQDSHRSAPADKPWLSLATSEKGSYKATNVLACLDRQFPPVDPDAHADASNAEREPFADGL